MFSRSLLLLATAGAAVAQLAPECESVSDIVGLLQGDDSKAYCSSVLSIGTTTGTVFTTVTETESTTVTLPTQVTLSLTTTQTDVSSSGTVTQTAPVVTETATILE
jgi:hypothetical protein